MQPAHDDANDSEALRPLRDAGTSADRIGQIARDRRLMRRYEAKRLLCAHPRAPLPLATRFLPHLRWRDLARMAADATTHPALRAAIEARLGVHLQAMTIGEQISFARVATRPLVSTLLESRDVRVLGAVLQNPRVCEPDVRRLAESDTVPPRLLERMIADPNWGARISVRAAVAANPRTPVHQALRALDGLDSERLSSVARNERARELVRVGAQRRLASETPV